MKRTSMLVLALWTSAFLLPLVAYRAGGAASWKNVVSTSAHTGASTAKTKPPGTETAHEPHSGTVSVMVDSVLTEYELEELVAAVVAAEMPALFPEQALRAQSVAARTYIYYKEGVDSSAHPDAVICDDPACCCALADLNTLAVSWGENGSSYIRRITDAVADTRDMVLYYDSKPALTVFHAMSGSKTNSAKDIWGTDVPYLVSVDAPEGESELNGYTDSVVVSKADFKKVFLEKYPDAVLSDDDDAWFENILRAPSGTVLSAEVGGVTVNGMSIRFLCGLKSADFTVTQGADRLLFNTEGYGHGVGMSQNGAKVLALSGWSYQDILSYYYPGTVLAAKK